MDLDESKDFIEYLLDNIQEDEVLQNQNKITKIISNACKESVKAHDILINREIERLILDLSKLTILIPVLTDVLHLYD